jgi:hypothetical protein
VLSVPRHGACEDCHEAFAANLLEVCEARGRHEAAATLRHIDGLQLRHWASQAGRSQTVELVDIITRRTVEDSVKDVAGRPNCSRHDVPPLREAELREVVDAVAHLFDRRQLPADL